MASGLKELKALIERERSAGGQLRSPARREVLELIERARSSGTSYRDIADGVGVKFQTLMSWRAQQQQSSALVAVRVSVPVRGATVHGPRGLRIEGLSLDDVAALWLRLSP